MVINYNFVTSYKSDQLKNESSGSFLCFFAPCMPVFWGLPWWLSGKEFTCNAGAAGDTGSVPGLGRFLEEGMATHCSTLAWRIPWTEEPGELQSMGSQRVAHD